MSKPGFKIFFDDPPLPADVVSIAIAPMDAFSGRLVTAGVKAAVKGLRNRPIKNVSGHLVFKNLPAQDTYTVTVDPTEAGYFVPEETDFRTPQEPRTRQNTLHLVRLMRRPEFPFDGATTLIRGVVVRGGDSDAVKGAVIWAFMKPTPSVPKPLRFETRSDDRGAFALPLTLPPSHSDAKEPVPVTLHLEHGDVRVLENLPIKDGKSHSFCEPIDLTGSKTPGFFPCPEPGGAT